MQEKWIGDQSLVTILQDDYGLKFVDKRSINKYLPIIYLSTINCTNVRINALKRIQKKLINVMFYYFSKLSIVPSHLSTKTNGKMFTTTLESYVAINKILQEQHSKK